VEQSAWQEPIILASLVEISDDTNSPFIDIVENCDTDEFESVADSGMFDFGNIHNAHVTQSSTISEEGENITPQQVSKKRKKSGGNALDHVDGDSSSPVRKIKMTTKTPTSQSSSSEINVDVLDSQHSHQPLTVTESSQTPPVEAPVRINPQSSTSNTKEIATPPPSTPDNAKSSTKKQKTSSKILPKPSKADSSGDKDISEDEAHSGGNPEVENSVGDTSVEPHLLQFQPLQGSSKTPVENTKTKKSSDRKVCPPGFIDESIKGIQGAKNKIRLTAPNGKKFQTYASAWAWLDKNPATVSETVSSKPVESSDSSSDSDTDSSKESSSSSSDSEEEPSATYSRKKQLTKTKNFPTLNTPVNKLQLRQFPSRCLFH